MSTIHPSPLDQLANRLGVDWPSLRAARMRTIEERQALENCLRIEGSSDTTLVVFGSVARREWTSGSDIDWILLIDGQSSHEHKSQERRIAKSIQQKYKEPGRSGVFGTMVSGHDLVHNIGGEDDSNANTTRRVLMLLESHPVGNAEAYERVRRQIMRPYLEDDRGLLFSRSNRRIPRFLLNDFTRYWRTVTVDFVYKQRSDDKKWALRNAKLRMSRKLVFAAGLLRVYFCALDPEANEARLSLRSSSPDIALLLSYMEQQLTLTPSELVAKACLLEGVKPETARAIFDNYDRFLSLLDDPDKRQQLEAARVENGLASCMAWNEVGELSQPFHDGLVSLFLRDDTELRELTMEYGVF